MSVSVGSRRAVRALSRFAAMSSETTAPLPRSVSDYDVVVVGAGVAGCTAAHALATSVSPPPSILVIDRGSAGRGSKATLVEDTTATPWVSGTAVFEPPNSGTVKMMVSLYASTSEEFLKHHSVADGRTWFKMTALGLALQKRKGLQTLSDPERQLRQLGSVMVAPASDAAGVRREYELLKSMGCNVEALSSDEVVAVAGKSSGFVCGLKFPDDAIIDSATYSECLLAAAAAVPGVTIWNDSDEVVRIDDGNKQTPATVVLAGGKEVTAGKIVIATGAFYHGGHLAGLLRPCYSYLVGMPSQPADPASGGGMAHPSCPNLFTYGFSHDWCVVDNVVRMSGEDHYSALKPDLCESRCRNLATWTYEHFPQLDQSQPFVGRAGVYSETPDLLPIFGSPAPQSRLCYIVGCNAWGQAIMSSLGDIVPAALGFREFTADEREIAQLCSIRRFTVSCSDTTDPTPASASVEAIYSASKL
eukprot:m.129044 g.129044  ORF g.129044 m.129044 type:complete len:474 (+) comp22304_c0_seq1:20-1441(+)